ncbi:MAG: response regulator transcription factor [Elusimicrobiota bacterium]
MRVLVVEDDEKVLSFLKKGFKEHGLSVDTASDGREGFFLAIDQKYDCIVLDIMMPNLDGYEVLRQLRERKNMTPVIFLTAKDTVQDRVRGLETGADDYLVKPFAFSELLARVRAVARRRKDEDITKFQVDDLMLDISKRLVVRKGEKISLTPTEFTLLHCLLERKGEVVTRTALLENVWGYDFDSTTNVIDVHMTNLRKKINEAGSEELIHTVRGVGYVLEKRK